MKSDGVINELIPADDLHWSEDDGYCVLSGEEVDQILMACCNNCCMSGGDEDFEEIMSVIRWAEQTRTDQLLLKQFIEGNIVITVTDEDGPHFMRKDKFDEYLDSFRSSE